MHIKSIAVSGFKTYKDVSVDLDAGHNVFVGRNGSGKSNFFEAIRFVFGDDIDQLRSGDSRQSLLHQGKSETNMNASVSIVIDNSDQRIPNSEGGGGGGSDIKLMRMVGLKKDEYFINGRRATKQEVTQLLEMAGLSSSNPYYVVAQGRVAKMSDMSDEQRLQLLQEVAGTRVYEARRAESVRILEESKAKSDSIAALMSSLDERLGELQAESKELEEYMGAERKRRAIEYVLYSHELEKAGEALKELEDGHGGSGAGLATQRAETELAVAASKANASALTAKKEALAGVSAEAAAAKKSLPKLQEKRVKMGEKVANLRAAVAADKMGAAEAAKELALVQVEVEARRKELAELEPGYKAAQAGLDQARMAAATVEQRMNALSDKAGRAARFKSKKERDAFLSSAVGQHRGEQKAAEAAAKQQEGEAGAQADKAKKVAGEAAAYDKAAADKGKEAAAAATSLDALQGTKAAAQSKSHTAKARLDECEKKQGELEGRVSAAEAAVFANMPHALRKGLEELAKLSNPANKEYIPGIHGPLYELIKPAHDRYNIPIEAVAGAELFNVVVADETVAAKIVTHLNKAKAGRLTFMPLARLKPSEQKYPASDDCRPLVGFIQHDPAYAAAVKQQFGRVLLCRNSEVAAKFAREQGFICVTLEGDTANKSGALTGGYINPAEARLKNVKAKQDAAAELTVVQQAKAAAEAAAVAADAEVKAASSALLDADDKARRLRDDIARLHQDAARKRAEADAARAKAEAATREAVRLREQANLMATRIKDLEEEMATDMTSKLTAGEQATLERLTKEVEDAKKALAGATTAFEAKRSQRQQLTSQLEDNLLRRVAELQKRMSKAGGADAGSASQDELRDLEAQLQAVMEQEARAKARLEDLQAKVAQHEADIARLQDEFNAVNAKAIALSDQLRAAELEDGKFLEKKRAVLSRKEEAAMKLRDIGTLPTSALEKYTKLKRKALVDELGKVHEQLRQLQHVNKRSSAELESFSKQREELQERFEELQRSDAEIHDLIESLDAKKDEKILTTFKGVQKHFQTIFSELVPRGAASLILRTVDDEEDDGAEGSKKKGRKSDVRMERFIGVGIKASFSDASQSGNKSLLSGGQRTILALALIFAIQRADPAPFYILDEVDAALDPTHRSAVGAMIKTQTSGKDGVQFITSSFWEELLEYGDKWFGVSMSNQASSIEELSKGEAVAFVAAARRDDAAAATNAKAPTSSVKKAKMQAGGEPSPAGF